MGQTLPPSSRQNTQRTYAIITIHETTIIHVRKLMCPLNFPLIQTNYGLMCFLWPIIRGKRVIEVDFVTVSYSES